MDNLVPPIGVNGRFLLGLGRGTGVHRAAWNWLRSLAATAPPGRRFLVVAPRAPGIETAIEGLRGPALEIALAGTVRGRAAAHLWEQLILPRLLAARGCRILLSLANTAPLRTRLRSVVAIMDASFMESPRWFGAPFRIWYRFLVPATARRADRVVTISEFSRREISRHFRIPPERIDAVHLGVDHAGWEEAASPDPEAWRPPATPYILGVGTLEPRKNLPVLLEAYGLLRARCPDLPQALLVAGGAGDVFAAQRLDPPPGVRFLGYLPERDLVACYRGADLFVYPSLYEGFGFPPLEAMSLGTPAVVARSGALPETAGDGAETFDPRSSPELAALLEAILSDPERRNALRARGLARAAGFRWERSARRLQEILDGVEAAAIGDRPG